MASSVRGPAPLSSRPQLPPRHHVTSSTSWPTTNSDDIRLEDYLDDKLQSSTDLEAANLTALISQVETQRQQLQKQLDTATQHLSHARRGADDRQALLLGRIADFRAQQERIDVRRRIIAESDAPDDAVRRLSGPLTRLHRVEMACRYVEMLRDVDTWKRQVLTFLPHRPKDALEPYRRIRKLAARLADLQSAADGAGVYLVGFVNHVADGVWKQMQDLMRAELVAVLKKRGWPDVKGVDPSDDSEDGGMDNEWKMCIGRLIDVQMPEILYGQGVSTTSDKHSAESARTTGSNSRPVVSLLAMDVMTRVFVQEFRFHFLSDRPTSKPEALPACFRWFITLVSKWEDFMRLNLAALLANKFRDTAVDGNLAYVDPVAVLITSLLPCLQEKVMQIADIAVSRRQAQFLSSLISDVTEFDDKIRRRFHYDGGDADNGWPGLAAYILDTHFDVWFNAEKQFALDRFEGIMTSSEARAIDYDFGPPGKIKPTFGAVRIMDLIRNVTTTYEHLRRFEYQVMFLVSVQHVVLEEYNVQLRDSLEAYQNLTSTVVGWTMAGSTAGREQLAALEGIGALESLCKVLGSADHVARTLETAAMDDFFVGLWNDLQFRVRRLLSVPGRDPSADPNPQLPGTPLSYGEIRTATSPGLGALDDGDEAADSTIFDADIASFIATRAKAEEMLVSALGESHWGAFKFYMTRTQWVTLSDDTGTDTADALSLPPTAALQPALETVARNMEYTARTIAAPQHRRVWRLALSALSDMLWNHVLLANHSFTTIGAKQLRRDVAALAAVARAHLAVDSCFTMLEDAVRLLALDIHSGADGAISMAGAVIDADASSGGNGNGSGDMAHEGEATEVTGSALDSRDVVPQPGPGLHEVYERVFSGNVQARDVLDELGLTTLTPTNARNILQRRVEAVE